MKTLFLVAALAVSCSVAAQIQVSTRKTIKVSDREQKTIEAKVADGDTSYSFCFRNARYSAISSFECAKMSKSDMKDFVDGMVELTKEKHVAGEASVDLGDIRLEKEKMMGAPYIRVLYQLKAWTSYRVGQCFKVQDEVYDFMGLP